MVERGDVWWVDFGTPAGSEPGFMRPGVVISSGRFNRSRISTVTVVAVTSQMRWAEAPGNVELKAGAAGLSKDCVVNVSQVMTIDRRQLVERLGTLDMIAMHKVDQGLRLALAL